MTITGLKNLGRMLRSAVVHPAALVLVPLIFLVSDPWERRVLIGALVVCVLARSFRPLFPDQRPSAKWSLPDQAAFDAYLAYLLRSGGRAHAACLLVRPNDADPAGGECDRTFSSDTIERLAEQIRPVLREDDFMARVQTDTIAVALSNRTALSIESVIQVALRLQRRADMPVAVGAPLAGSGVRVGIAISADGDDAVRLRDRADRALADAGPGAIRCEAADAHDSGALSVELARDLPAAFDRGELIAHFQPQICTDTGAVTGVEALARWQHPRHGLLAPGQFLDICEAADLMSHLSEAMVRNALEALGEWDREGIRVPRVSVNFTLKDLSDPSFVDRIQWMLDAADVKPDRLGVEVLESVLYVHGERAVSQTLERLREMGCLIDLDDFGTGSASITSIRRFAVERLKIDRSFVRGVDHDPEQRDMVAAILTMAEQLDIDTLAEGVETPEELAMLARLGCRHVQGFGIGKPMPRAEFPGWLAMREMPDPAAHVPEAPRRIPAGAPLRGAAGVASARDYLKARRGGSAGPSKGGQGKTA